eukprot:1742408-Alexandrium_andersonii.AAC.1
MLPTARSSLTRKCPSNSVVTLMSSDTTGLFVRETARAGREGTDLRAEGCDCRREASGSQGAAAVEARWALAEQSPDQKASAPRAAAADCCISAAAAWLAQAAAAAWQAQAAGLPAARRA